jgi:hypothetical protein
VPLVADDADDLGDDAAEADLPPARAPGASSSLSNSRPCRAGTPNTWPIADRTLATSTRMGRAAASIVLSKVSNGVRAVRCRSRRCQSTTSRGLAEARDADAGSKGARPAPV